MPRTRPPYPPEFREEAIRLTKTSGDSIRQVAKDLGISDQTLRNWVNQADVDAGKREGLTTEERTELRELRKENRKLREEREILRKAAAFSQRRPSAGSGGASLHPRGEGQSLGRRPLSGAGRLAGGPSRTPRSSRRSARSTPTRAAPTALRGCERCSPGAASASGKSVLARLMRREEISGLIRPKKGRTTIRVPGVATAPDLVRREWNPGEPNRLWVADITCCRTWEGWLYLAAVLDCYSRRCVGWSIRDDLRAELVSDAVQMAIAARRPEGGLIHHSDRGSQYVSLAFGQHCREAGIDLSMTQGGSPQDNAVAESFFSTLKRELVNRYS